MNFVRRQSINDNSLYCLEKEVAYCGVAPIYGMKLQTSPLASPKARPLTRSDTETTLNPWGCQDSFSYEGSGSFHYKDATGFPNSRPLGRSDTVSSFNSTWDEHIISSSRDEWNRRSFTEYSNELPDQQHEYGLEGSSHIDDDSQSMTDREESYSDDDTRTECGDYPEYCAERSVDVQMESESEVDAHFPLNHNHRITPRLPSPHPSIPTNPQSSALSPPAQYTGLITRSRRRELEQRQAASDGATFDVPPIPSNHDSTGYHAVWGTPPNKRCKFYVCNSCDLIMKSKYKAEMALHVRSQHL